METITIEWKIGFSKGVTNVTLEENWVMQCQKFDQQFTSWKVL